MAVALKVSEDSHAEQPALEWLVEQGWSYVHGSEIAPGAPAEERKLWSDVVLVGRLPEAVARINPELPDEAVRRAVELTLTTSSTEVMLDHQDFHEFLIEGVPVAYWDGHGIEWHARARLVDFEKLANNDFLAVNQLRVVVGTKNRRLDIVLFVNGLPLGQVELKNPADEEATPQAAANQVAHYGETIPKLYRFIEIVGVSDLLQARVGTLSTPPEHFAEWGTMDPKDSEGKSALEVMLCGVFEPARFLDLVQNFVIFESDGPRTHKVMAKYHQFDAVNRAVEATHAAMGSDGRGGVVWHTQGAGKSYTMSFYVTKLRRDPRFENPTIVALTDRKDLDQQLMKTFARQTHLAPAVRQAERIAGGEGSLHDLLKVPAGGIVFTTIQKFMPATGQDEMPVLSERRNVIVMADEAHRSEYGAFARNVTVALPKATRIGFTGTPIEQADKSTRTVFGDYISIYRMRQAQEDGATVPIFYESRQVPVEVADPEQLKKVEKVLESEEEAAAAKLITNWAKLEKAVGADDRLDKVAADLAEHYRKRTKTLDGKAMVVGYSRRICAELTKRLQKHLGAQAVTCVMTAQATDDPAISKWRRSSQEMRQVEADFKDPAHPLRVVVVRDMWLTGFDVPALHSLYIDKPMRDHGLLQAIARVNRVFRDKPGGLVVDYIGIGDDLRASLTAYSKQDVDDVVVPLAQAISKLREKHEIVCDLLHGIEFRPSEGMSAGQKATLFSQAVRQAVDRFVESDEKTKEFLDHQTAFAKWFSLVSPDQAAVELSYDASFFTTVAKELRAISPVAGQASKEAEQAVKQFFAEGLSAGSIVDVFELSGEDRPELSVLSDEFLDGIKGIAQPNLQVALLRKLLNDEIKSRMRSNKIQAKQFSEEVEGVLARYHQKQLTSAEVVSALVELAKKLRDAKKRHEELGLSAEEAAFYDALAGHAEDWKADPKLAQIAGELVKNIKSDLAVDWTDRKNTEAQIRSKIKRLLRKHGYKPPAPKGGAGGKALNGLDWATQLVLDQARVLYRYWPDVEVGDALFVEQRI